MVIRWLSITKYFHFQRPCVSFDTYNSGCAHLRKRRLCYIPPKQSTMHESIPANSQHKHTKDGLNMRYFTIFLCHARLYALESYRIGWLAVLQHHSNTSEMFRKEWNCVSLSLLVRIIFFLNFTISPPFSFSNDFVGINWVCACVCVREKDNRKVHIVIITYSHMQQVLIAVHTYSYQSAQRLREVFFSNFVVELIIDRHLFSFVDDNEAAVLLCGGRFFTCFELLAIFLFLKAPIRGSRFAVKWLTSFACAYYLNIIKSIT